MQTHSQTRAPLTTSQGGQMSSLNLGTVAASLAALAVILGFARVIFRLIRRTGHFLDDWNGEAPRPGQPARPGVLEQLESVQAEQTRVSKELQHNGGGSQIGRAHV